MNPKSSTAQFIVAGVTGVTLGKRVKTNSGTSQHNAATLIVRPAVVNEVSILGFHCNVLSLQDVLLTPFAE